MANAYPILPNDISDFRVVPYDFLSNMYSSPVTILGQTFECAEAAFQAHKVTTIPELKQFVGLNGYEAKRLGRQVTLRYDWPQIKLQVMANVLEAKFRPGSELTYKLLNTGNKRLVEGNTWNDVYWGVCNGKGQNKLGQLLMERRAFLRGVAHG
jgi:ribA/ribD-fused uncharacterized protein